MSEESIIVNHSYNTVAALRHGQLDALDDSLSIGYLIILTGVRTK